MDNTRLKYTTTTVQNNSHIKSSLQSARMWKTT